MPTLISKALRYDSCVARDHTVLPATHTRTRPAFTPQPQGITALRLVPICTAWWTEAHRCEKLAQGFYAVCPAETRTHDLSIASPILYRQRHDATIYWVGTQRSKYFQRLCGHCYCECSVSVYSTVQQVWLLHPILTCLLLSSSPLLHTSHLPSSHTTSFILAEFYQWNLPELSTRERPSCLRVRPFYPLFLCVTFLFPLF